MILFTNTYLHCLNSIDENTLWQTDTSLYPILPCINALRLHVTDWTFRYIIRFHFTRWTEGFPTARNSRSVFAINSRDYTYTNSPVVCTVWATPWWSIKFVTCKHRWACAKLSTNVNGSCFWWLNPRQCKGSVAEDCRRWCGRVPCLPGSGNGGRWRWVMSPIP